MTVTDYIDTLIDRAGRTRDKRLPTIAAMAAQSGFSHYALSRALRTYVAKGILVAKRGGGIRLAGAEREDFPAAPNKTRSDAVHDTLVTELHRGQFPDDRLPSLSELCHRFSVHPATMRKVLRRMCVEGWLHREGRAYRRARAPAGGSHANAIVFIGGNLDTGISMNIPPRSQDFIRTFDIECTRRRLRLHVVGLGEYLHSGRDGLPESALGAILWPFAASRRQVDTAVVMMSRMYRRTALLDELNMLAHPGAVAHNFPRFHCYSVAHSTVDGEIVGRYLLQRGHSKIAFISHCPDEPWSLVRREGIERVCHEAGVGVSFSVCAPKRPLSPLPDLTPEAVTEAAIRTSDLALAGHDGFAKTPLADTTRQSMRNQARAVAYLGILYDRMRPVFRDALERSCTVWVCTNDELGSLAKSFLAAEGLQVPRDISLASFDDSPVALTQRLTSYNFNTRAIVHSMLEDLLHLNAPRRPLVQHVPGFVTERGSVARVD